MFGPARAGFPSAAETATARSVFPTRQSVVALLCAVAGAAQEPAAWEPRPVSTVLEAQVELHRRGFSCGAIDGVAGGQTAAALRAFQRARGLGESGALDAATREYLWLTAAALKVRTLMPEDFSGLRPLPATWLEKSLEPDLAHASLLERIAEQHRAGVNFLRRLNPGTDWDALEPGATVSVPAVGPVAIAGRAAQITIRLEARELEAIDAEGRVLLHCPVSIARKVEKRPSGELQVIVIVREPNYTFDPEVFPESEEGRELGRRLIIPPGPNNPVGRAWIGLNLPGYGIHGTPDPEKVGRTESHGCFRLANWDAVTLLNLARVGLVVRVEP
ncbi:MAG: murein L,D-transpeptidase [Opitutaceae bacterium]|nr:murein L,D-transpeptidase [Opitutaceae bacterium]